MKLRLLCMKIERIWKNAVFQVIVDGHQTEDTCLSHLSGLLLLIFQRPPSVTDQSHHVCILRRKELLHKMLRSCKRWIAVDLIQNQYLLVVDLALRESSTLPCASGLCRVPHVGHTAKSSLPCAAHGKEKHTA